MKKILIILVSFFIFTGCTQLYNSNEVALSDVNTELTYQEGIVEDVKNIVLKDDGSGTVIGAYTGTVLGSMFGEGKGNTISTLLGGLAGAFVGYEADKANAQELFIRLDDGRKLVVVVKGINIQKGDKIRLVKRGNKIVRVEKI